LPGRTGVELVVETELGFDELSEILDRNLKGRKFPRRGGQQVVIEQAGVAGSQLDRGEHLLVIRLRLGGITSSEVYVRGRLSYRARKGEVRLADPDYTVETEDLFVAALDAINHEAFRRRLARIARWDLRTHLEEARERLQALLPGKTHEKRDKTGLQLRGRIDSLEPVDYAVTDRSIVFRMAARGTLQIDYRP
jgi:hypothetical protein